MRVSEHYSLGLTQPVLEFLDVDVVKDTKVFVDPHAFTYLTSDWGRECVSLLQDFYSEVLDAVRANDRARGLYLLGQLGESNEAHLGLSEFASEGSGVANGLGADIFDALRSSAAMATGLLTDVEDTVLFVEGIGHDRVSDKTINIVRKQLIEFTQRVCATYGIPMVPGLDSGPMWNRHSHSWDPRLVELPMPNGKLLLVPRAVVRKSSTFDPGDYLTHFVLPYLQKVELATPRSSLIQKRTSRRLRGEKYVTKKSLRERDGIGKSTKEWNAEVTANAPEILEQYRDDKATHTEPPGHEEIAAATGSPLPDWDALLEDVLAIPSGKDHADDYHRAVQHLLTALFYPALDMPVREFRTHEGRKRIDIVYTNLAESGFFHWLGNAGGVSSGLVIIECKNYTGKLKNPEFDQLTGRFSPRRGQFGLLCYRGFKDHKAEVVQHCRDAALDDRGYVIALDDDDFKILVESRKAGGTTMFEYLMGRFQELI
jgi:hypothetical protein